MHRIWNQLICIFGSPKRKQGIAMESLFKHHPSLTRRVTIAENPSLTRRVTMALMIVLVVGASQLNAQEKLPTAKSVVERHLKSIGGREKLDAIKTLSVSGTVEVSQAGLKGSMQVFLSQDGHGLSVLDLGPAGIQKTGSDGKIYWAETSKNSDVLSGKKADQARMQLTILPVSKLNRLFEKSECKAVEEFEGEACFRIDCTMKNGFMTSYFFSKESGLELGSKSTISTAAGDMEVIVVRKEYKEVEGIFYSHRTEMKFPNDMVQAFTLEKLEINAPIPPGTFDIPQAILQKLPK